MRTKVGKGTQSYIDSSSRQPQATPTGASPAKATQAAVKSQSGAGYGAVETFELRPSKAVVEGFFARKKDAVIRFDALAKRDEKLATDIRASFKPGATEFRLGEVKDPGLVARLHEARFMPELVRQEAEFTYEKAGRKVGAALMGGAAAVGAIGFATNFEGLLVVGLAMLWLGLSATTKEEPEYTSED